MSHPDLPPIDSDEVPGTVEGSGLSAVDAMHLVLQAAAATAAAGDWKGILAGLEAGLRTLFRAEEIVLALADGDGGGFLVRRIAIGTGTEPAEEWVACDEENPIGWVVVQRRSLWRNDLATDVRFPAAGSSGSGSEILVPLGPRDSPWGVLGCRAGRSYAFRLVDVKLLERFAQVAGASLTRIRQLRKMRRRAFHDGLTGILNRGSFQRLLEGELERCLRFDRRLALLLIDVDDFKRINDSCGHSTGDRVLIAVAGILKSRFRRFDIVARYGGEEFAVVLPEAPLAGGRQAAEKVRAAMHAIDWSRNAERSPSRVTVSIGVSEFPGCARSAADLIRSADAALYRAKGSGKDRVEIATPLP